MVRDRAAGRKHGGVIHLRHDLDVIFRREAGEIVWAATNQRPLAQPGAGRADDGDRLGGGGDGGAAEPEVDGRRPRGDPGQHFVVGLARHAQRQRTDEGPPVLPGGPLLCQLGHAQRVIGLNLQRRPRGRHGLRGQTERLALRALGRAGDLGLQPAEFQGVRREEVQRGQRNAEALGDVGGEPLLVHPGHQQAGIGRQAGQRLALFGPDLGDALHEVRQSADRILHVADEIGGGVELLAAVRPVGDRGKAGRFGQGELVGRHRDHDVVAPALQLPRDGGTGFDVAAAAVGGQHTFHQRNLTRGGATNPSRAGGAQPPGRETAQPDHGFCRCPADAAAPESMRRRPCSPTDHAPETICAARAKPL